MSKISKCLILRRSSHFGKKGRTHDRSVVEGEWRGISSYSFEFASPMLHPCPSWEGMIVWRFNFSSCLMNLSIQQIEVVVCRRMGGQCHSIFGIVLVLFLHNIGVFSHGDSSHFGHCTTSHDPSVKGSHRSEDRVEMEVTMQSIEYCHGRKQVALNSDAVQIPLHEPVYRYRLGH